MDLGALVTTVRHRSATLDTRLVPSLSDAACVAEMMSQVGPLVDVAGHAVHSGERYSVLINLLAVCGLRPGEAVALGPDDIVVTNGDTELWLTGSENEVWAKYSDDGSTRRKTHLKQRDPSAVRVVPVPSSPMNSGSMSNASRAPNASLRRPRAMHSILGLLQEVLEARLGPGFSA